VLRALSSRTNGEAQRAGPHGTCGLLQRILRLRRYGTSSSCRSRRSIPHRFALRERLIGRVGVIPATACPCMRAHRGRELPGGTAALPIGRTSWLRARMPGALPRVPAHRGRNHAYFEPFAERIACPSALRGMRHCPVRSEVTRAGSNTTCASLLCSGSTSIPSGGRECETGSNRAAVGRHRPFTTSTSRRGLAWHMRSIWRSPLGVDGVNRLRDHAMEAPVFSGHCESQVNYIRAARYGDSCGCSIPVEWRPRLAINYLIVRFSEMVAVGRAQTCRSRWRKYRHNAVYVASVPARRVRASWV